MKNLIKQITIFSTLVALVFWVVPPVVIDSLIALAVFGSFAYAVYAYFKRDEVPLKNVPKITKRFAQFYLVISVVMMVAVLKVEGSLILKVFSEKSFASNPFLATALCGVLMLFYFVLLKGYSRTAWVQARFDLDAMPGRQLSIDIKVEREEITPEEGSKRRIELYERQGTNDEIVRSSEELKKFSKVNSAIFLLGVLVVSILPILGITSGTHDMVSYFILIMSGATVYALGAIFLIFGNTNLVMKMTK